MFEKELEECLKYFEALRNLKDRIEKATIWTVEAIKNGGKVLIFGNGGSAADAQHFAAELVNRFLKDRKPLPAISLATDTSILTSVGNDYGFDLVFKKQIEALGKRGDLVYAISTSGKSKNVIEGVKVAKEMGLKTIGLTGKGGGDLKDLVDLLIDVPSRKTPRIQEMHVFIYHYIAGRVEEALA